MNITLQVNNSDFHVINKNITDVSSLSGYLRESSSIINPVVMIEVPAGSIAGCNYMTISEFGRSYYITDIESVRANLTRVTAHVDVLYTYRNQILNATGIIKRQQNLWNLYLDDGVFKVYNNPQILTKAFPSGFSTMSFILAVAGGAGGSSSGSGTGSGTGSEGSGTGSDGTGTGSEGTGGD